MLTRYTSLTTVLGLTAALLALAAIAWMFVADSRSIDASKQSDLG